MNNQEKFLRTSILKYFFLWRMLNPTFCFSRRYLFPISWGMQHMSVVWNSNVARIGPGSWKVLRYVVKLQFLAYWIYFKDGYSDKRNKNQWHIFTFCNETTAFLFSLESILLFWDTDNTSFNLKVFNISHVKFGWVSANWEALKIWSAVQKKQSWNIEMHNHMLLFVTLDKYLQGYLSKCCFC